MSACVLAMTLSVNETRGECYSCNSGRPEIGCSPILSLLRRDCVAFAVFFKGAVHFLFNPFPSRCRANCAHRAQYAIAPLITRTWSKLLRPTVARAWPARLDHPEAPSLSASTCPPACPPSKGCAIHPGIHSGVRNQGLTLSTLPPTSTPPVGCSGSSSSANSDCPRPADLSNSLFLLAESAVSASLFLSTIQPGGPGAEICFPPSAHKDPFSLAWTVHT